ncbi:protein mono-ADP-ribosyltransferase TIPARP-like [Chaetodon trifascialis]|uniref:protein mono-ADP-ribosyltransferase TIPARP-like n=1 Tax=Chaetodon trifascialis TaxID=109706 RepID=UPI003996C2C5
MSYVSSRRRTKRKMADDVLAFEPPSKASKVTLLSPSLLLLEIPADANTSLPAWEAVRSQQLDVTWSINPYSISVHLTPVASMQSEATPSGKSGRTSVGTQTSAPSSIVQSPKVIVQSIGQQHDACQKTSCVLLTFLENSNQSPGQPQKIPTTHTPGTSLLVSLPLIIAHPQPPVQSSIPAKEVVLPAIQTRTKLQAQSKAPVRASFHTRSSTNIQICDNFLLSLCNDGEMCDRHHTPLPFHWQLWYVAGQQWIDLTPRNQILLERLYSNVNQDSVCIRDGQVSYSLDFDSMKLDNSFKYARVRRLTNSDQLVNNPFFPSKWKIYWWNSISWEEYNESVSPLLLQRISEKEAKCSFTIYSQTYEVDFDTMIQTNVKTSFQRKVRCRPIYRSPDSMQPHLQTRIHTDPTEPASNPPPANFSVDPLEEFSSWYPPVWHLASDEDCSLVDVPAGTQAFQRVKNLFYQSLPETEVDVISIQQVQNLLHWDKYQRHKVYMQKQHTESAEPLERHLFHGTTRKASEDICHNNFDPRLAGINGASCGLGSYFAISASISHSYSGSRGVRHMFLAKVLVGRVSLGNPEFRHPPPLKSETRQHCLYDSCVDNVHKPTMFVVFDSCQCYPYYLIKYKDLPREIKM